MLHDGQCCENCGHWIKDDSLIDDGAEGMCIWYPIIPFWAYIGDNDHSDYTLAKDGKDCLTWSMKD